MTVHLLQHRKAEDDYESVKALGIYATREDAEDAIGRFLRLPGFSEHPDGFSIDEYTVGKDCWPEGFVPWSESVGKKEGDIPGWR
ncbi:hypothetical protein Pla175_50400 [Pirellulimonas nuda]|uniref:DUF7336 domain-containing protein n=1 Tax=Pirellulimonas nuda TaxID=2528009 RepID=A0A518DJF5_9BACT|nr:hypothetical protein [Pirellulimonas nuda]QDU91610.1 hypothetical protein Pla175_50400 [Pirellulimonas nuda]